MDDRKIVDKELGRDHSNTPKDHNEINSDSLGLLYEESRPGNDHKPAFTNIFTTLANYKIKTLLPVAMV